MQALIGIFVLLGLARLLSENRQSPPWRLLGVGVALQFLLAVLFLKVSWIAEALYTLNFVVAAIEQATTQGTAFLFGYLGGGSAPFEISDESATYLFAFRVLPQVIVFSAIIAILWYWRVLPLIVRGFGWVLEHTLKLSGPLGTAGAASLFLGMVETPMVIRAYLKKLTRADLFCVMTFGMSPSTPA